jgi:hypothetical protein
MTNDVSNLSHCTLPFFFLVIDFPFGKSPGCVRFPTFDKYALAAMSIKQDPSAYWNSVLILHKPFPQPLIIVALEPMGQERAMSKEDGRECFQIEGRQVWRFGPQEILIKPVSAEIPL